jgi:cytochrome c biogenesis protein ResB
MARSDHGATLSGNDREQGGGKSSQQNTRTETTSFLIAGTLAMAFLFADIILSIYYYQNKSGADLRWLLALLDLGLVLSLLSLAGKRVSRLLRSMWLTVILLFVIAILSIIGTILPNKDQVVESGWINNPLYDFYDAIGFFDMYYSRWYLFLLFFLTANLSWCIYKRIHVTLKNAIHPKVDVRDSFISSQPLSASFPGGDVEDFRKAISGHRYRMHKASSGAVLAEKGRFSALASITFHLSFIFLGVGGIIGGMLGWTDQIYIPDGSTVDVPNTELQVTNHEFNIDYVTIEDERGLVVGYKPVEYTSDLEVTRNGEMVDIKTITVNGPLRVNQPGRSSMLNFLGSTSINLHQSAYDVTETGQYATILEVNYMPGKLIVYIGFVMMMVGITLALYVPHRRIWAKVTDDEGELVVGGRTNRSKVSFGREFNRIKNELGQEGREAGTDV